MIHTALQVLGLAIVMLGAWLAFGVGGVLIVLGLALATGSFVAEIGERAVAKIKETD